MKRRRYSISMETEVACWRWVGVDATQMNPANVVGGTEGEAVTVEAEADGEK